MSKHTIEVDARAGMPAREVDLLSDKRKSIIENHQPCRSVVFLLGVAYFPKMLLTGNQIFVYNL